MNQRSEDWYSYAVAKILSEDHPWIWAAELNDKPPALVRWWLERRARRIWEEKMSR